MKNKNIKKASNFFEKEIDKGVNNAIKIMNKDGFDGVNYHKVFNVDLSSEFASGPTAITSETSAGQAKLLGASATDIPTISVATTTTMLQIGGLIGIGVENNLYNVQKAMNAKSNTISKEAEQAYRRIEEAHHAIAWGTSPLYAKSNLLGFFTHPNIVRSEFEPNADGKIKWADKTPDEIVDDIVGAVRDYYALNEVLREGQVEVKIFLPATLFDVLTLTKMATDKDKSILQHLKKFLPENGFNVKFEIASALATKDKNMVAIGDFRASTMSYDLPLVTEGLDTFVVGLTIRKNFVAESRGLRVERKNAAIIYEGA